jgi:hypothetical protein
MRRGGQQHQRDPRMSHDFPCSHFHEKTERETKVVARRVN